jgi:hypothetical protein
MYIDRKAVRFGIMVLLCQKKVGRYYLTDYHCCEVNIWLHCLSLKFCSHTYKLLCGKNTYCVFVIMPL